MADIFISYQRDDRKWAAMLAQALEAQGWSVWWDTRITAGKNFDDIIEAELGKAKCVIVLWSKTSVKSRWVRAEAGDALERDTLVPALIQNVRPPLAFRRIHAVDMAGWKGNENDALFKRLVADIQVLLGPPPVIQFKSQQTVPGATQKRAAARKPVAPGFKYAAVAVLVVVVGLVYVLWFRPQASPATKPTALLSASKMRIASGDSTLLRWSTTQAESATIDPGVGNVPVAGRQYVTPDQTTTYRLEARGDRTAIDSVVVVVEGVTVPAPVEEPVTRTDPCSNDFGMDFKLIKAGSFVMGSNNGDDDEKPPHTVHISKDFCLGVYEVTQTQWEEVMGTTIDQQRNKAGYDNLYGEGSNHPMYYVSWNEVQDFLKRLNTIETCGACYRLPTEAEWEYAARAGTTTAYSFGDEASQLGNYAWYGENAGGTTHPVGEKLGNPWGLHDMHGNVWEWVADWYDDYASGSVTDPKGASSGSYRVIRGGGWSGNAGFARSALRLRGGPDHRLSYVGFRVLRTIP